MRMPHPVLTEGGEHLVAASRQDVGRACCSDSIHSHQATPHHFASFRAWRSPRPARSTLTRHSAPDGQGAASDVILGRQPRGTG